MLPNYRKEAFTWNERYVAFTTSAEIHLWEFKLDVYEIIEQIANKKAYLLKGGKIDEHRVFMEIIRDWQQGRLRL